MKAAQTDLDGNGEAVENVQNRLLVLCHLASVGLVGDVVLNFGLGVHDDGANLDFYYRPFLNHLRLRSQVLQPQPTKYMYLHSKVYSAVA